MPENTPNRGYTYPTYTDPTNFPAQMQELATDIDADIQTIIDQVSNARDNAPSATITDTDGQVLLANTTVTIPYDVTLYDNGGLVSSPTGFTVVTEGLYLITAWAMFLDDVTVYDVTYGIRVDGSTRANQMWRTNSGATGIRVSLTRVTYCESGDVIDTVIRANAAATIGTRYFSVSRMSGDGFLP